MKIRSHLVLMVGAVLLPVLVFATVLTVLFWSQQRTVFDQRFLEGTRAMAIALDTEIESSARALQLLALAYAGDRNTFADHALRTLATQPTWSMVGVVDRSLRPLQTVRRPGIAINGFIDAATVERAATTRRPVVTGILQLPDGRFVTAVAVPVLRLDEVRQVIYAGIEQEMWRRFVGKYPVGPDSTMTLLDQQHRIIVRTLNGERWTGKPPSDELTYHVVRQIEGAYRARGLEGQVFYTAHRRSIAWGWTLAIGVPVAGVETGVRDSTVAMAAGAGLTGLLAVILTVVFGRRIAQPIAVLAGSAKSLVSGSPPPGMRPFQRIDEVANVARAFAEAGALLREREQALSGALARERLARAEAEAANRAKDEFLAMLSHELRNPLNAITSALAVLDLAADPATASRSRDVITRQTRHLRALVDDLLDIARVAGGKIILDLQPLELGAAVQHTVSVMREEGRLDQHRIELDCAPVWVAGDEIRCAQIVGNLLENAVKYTPAGGRIGVAVRAEGDDAVVEISDNGTGIAPELLPNLFNLFTQGERTLDRAQGGLGLGLAVVRHLVELHGGSVAASSAGIGKGATFTVRLPRTAAPVLADAAAIKPGVAQRGLCILVIDDNADGRESLKVLLGLYGHDVHAAEDGPGGVERALALCPDVAIVDIGLPGFDGYEVARRLRASEQGQSIRLVALTGYGQERDRERARAAGFDEYLVKPVDPAALRHALESAVKV